jgi:hypothetical protein
VVLLAVPLAFEIPDIESDDLALGVCIASHEIVVDLKGFQNSLVETMVSDKLPVIDDSRELLKGGSGQFHFGPGKGVVYSRSGKEEKDDD